MHKHKYVYAYVNLRFFPQMFEEHSEVQRDTQLQIKLVVTTSYETLGFEVRRSQWGDSKTVAASSGCKKGKCVEYVDHASKVASFATRLP